MTGPKYDMLVIDLDGTLLGPNGRVAPEDAAAVRRARDRGVRIVVCTGRSLRESLPALHAVGQTDPVIVSGGAMVVRPSDGATLHRHAMRPDLVCRVVDEVSRHDHAALVLKDSFAAGFDYLVVGSRGGRFGADALDPAARWWFRELGVTVRFANDLSGDDHPEHTVRVGVCTADGDATPAGGTDHPHAAHVQAADLGERSPAQGVEALWRDMNERFGEMAALQRFRLEHLPASAKAEGVAELVHVMEVFDPRATKWQAVRELAADLGIPIERVAAIGDAGNDLEMIANAGLGVAMENALPAVKSAATKVTRSHADQGVSHAIERVLAGEW